MLSVLTVSMVMLELKQLAKQPKDLRLEAVALDVVTVVQLHL